MFVDFRGSVLSIFRWQWRAVLVYALVSTVVVTAEMLTDIDAFTVTNIPVTVIGAALGIFVSFRTNAAYDRWWEARKLWGRLVNTSRHFATQSVTFVRCEDDAETAEVRKGLVYRQIGYVHTLRCLLRGEDPLADGDVLQFLSGEDVDAIRGQSNATHVLLDRHQHELTTLSDSGKLEPLRLQSMDQSIAHLLDIQGGCERIKNTPFPRGYGFIAERLIWAYSLILPLSIVDEMHWLAIPTTILVCMAFWLISEVGRTLEDPFTLFWPALPLSALSRTIQVNLQERVGDTDLPPMLKPDGRGILM